jgi:DivIVA domain-containing protein
MTWFFAALVVVVMGVIAVVAAGRVGSMPPAYGDHPDVVLPDGPLGPGDLRAVRLPLAVRGYRMAEVDALLDRLAAQMEAAKDPGPEQDLPDDTRGRAPGD